MIDFELSDTQTDLIEAARNFATEVVRPAEILLDQMSDVGTMFHSKVFKDVMKQAFELGFHKMTISEKYGGLGLDPVTSGLVWEEIASKGPGIASTLISAGTVPRVITFIAANNQELIDEFVIPYCEDTTGEHVTAWGSSEPNVGSDGCNYYDPKIRHQTTAVRTEKGYELSGTKSDFISNGGIAKVYLMFACLNPALGIRGSGVFIVPRHYSGVSTGRVLDKIGLRALNQSAVFMEKVELPEKYMIFPPGEGYVLLHNAIHTVGNVGIGYLALGLMRAAYEDALAYSKERVQGGKPIFNQQLIAKQLFDTYQVIEATRAMLMKASWKSKQTFPGDLKLSIASKVFATTQAMHHTTRMQDVLGGYGISKEYRLEKYVRDATLLQVMDGANGILSLKGAALL
ncbi:MAG: acyl-CoA/acyl-ACP dehydrogenase [Deltaproteobacteria bacterium]|nr:acyl-CoA/acyl-ACP dehydrogenase [Deltaproteobacteria bacterium]